MEIILTHENADFDAIASLLAAHKLNPEALPVLPERMNQNVARFIMLYQNGMPFVRAADVDIAQVKQLIVVDTQRPSKLRGLASDLDILIIDHHPLSQDLAPNHIFSGEVVGAATTLLVEKIQTQAISLSTLEATLLALGIYEDTGSLSYGTTTPRDHRAAAWLLEQKASLDAVRQFLSHPLNDDQQALYEKLSQSAESKTIEGYIVTICTAKTDRYISEISSVAHRLRDTLDSAVLFVVVQLPENIQLVCRATVDGLNVGDVARLFGGGGHERAAAASIHDKNIDDVVVLLWQAAQERIQPLTRVADLMSYGVQTVEADMPIRDIVQKLRRIGHEGFPVLDGGKVSGLLTLRDADRAMEHNLGHLKVRDIMLSGSVTLQVSDSVWTIEQQMVESGWGQIPVLDETDKLIGIVTRTDLIKHWARIHPNIQTQTSIVSSEQIIKVLGKSVSDFMQKVAAHAHETATSLYMVGGVVRDLLLDRQNLDLDFVVEGNAIEFAEQLQKRYGGQINSFRPFGTAKWKLDTEAAEALDVPLDVLPGHIDFATARNEFYEHPTALPTVYNSSIKLDLGRRDFTINTLAVQMSPASAAGRILDFYGGQADLKAGLIRVLHSLSYVDDPTRILRTIRFEQRLGFEIETRTEDLIESAKPMLGRITGERLRNELTLLLREKQPEQGFFEMQQRGILSAIHHAFILPENLDAQFQQARTFEVPWKIEALDVAQLYWHVIAANIPQENLKALCERLMFAQSIIESMIAARQLIENIDHQTFEDIRVSDLVERLTDVPELALITTWLHVQDKKMRENIRRFWIEWRHIQPTTNGHTLHEMGLAPGRCYGVILKRLKEAWLDGEVKTEAEEKQLLQKLIHQGICDDRA